MTEHFLNYEQSLAVKELGFDEPCFGYYGESQEDSEIVLETRNVSQTGDLARIICSAPLKSQFFKWVRDNGIETTIVPMIVDTYKEYQFVIFTLDEVVETGFDTYEQAEDACINKIIEILKLK